MSRKTTKAEIILQGARDRVRVAKETVTYMESQLAVAVAILDAHRYALAELETDLTSTPRKVNAPKSTASSAGKRSRTASSETGKGNAGTVDLLPENPEEFKHGAPA